MHQIKTGVCLAGLGWCALQPLPAQPRTRNYKNSNRLDPSDHRARVPLQTRGSLLFQNFKNPSQIPIAPILQLLFTYGFSRSKTVNCFEKLKNPSTRRRRRRWQQKDTPLRTSHLLKKTPCKIFVL